MGAAATLLQGLKKGAISYYLVFPRAQQYHWNKITTVTPLVGLGRAKRVKYRVICTSSILGGRLGVWHCGRIFGYRDPRTCVPNPELHMIGWVELSWKVKNTDNSRIQSDKADIAA